jgi:hypothetical protein
MGTTVAWVRWHGQSAERDTGVVRRYRAFPEQTVGESRKGRLVLRIRGFHIRGPRLERKYPKCNDVQTRKDAEQAPKSTMARTTQEFNDRDEKQKKKHDRHHDENWESEKRLDVPTSRLLHAPQQLPKCFHPVRSMPLIVIPMLSQEISLVNLRNSPKQVCLFEQFLPFCRCYALRWTVAKKLKSKGTQRSERALRDTRLSRSGRLASGPFKKAFRRGEGSITTMIHVMRHLLKAAHHSVKRKRQRRTVAMEMEIVPSQPIKRRRLNPGLSIYWRSDFANHRLSLFRHSREEIRIGIGHEDTTG